MGAAPSCVRLCDNDNIFYMKTKKYHGQTVFICPAKDMPGNSKNVLSTNAATGEIMVNARLWPKLPNPIKYWLLRWAYWRYSGGEVQKALFADTMATRDYLKKGYKAKVLMLGFMKILKHSLGDANVNRITKMNKRLLNKK